MSRLSIHNVYIANGFVDDCDELLFQCSRLNPLTYYKFCSIWKEMKFDSIYNWRASGSEIAELSEEVLHIAKRYLVADTGNVEESIAGLFLVYGLLNLQPFPRFASLRLTPADVPPLRRLERVSRQQRRHDVLYVLGAVLQGSQCHVAARELGPDPALFKYLNGCTGIDQTGVRPRGVFYRQTEELDILREFDRLGKLYDKAKKNALDKTDLAKNLNYVDVNLASELGNSLKGVLTGTYKQRTEEEKDAQERSSQVMEIKERAMKNAVNSMRHLTAVPNNPTRRPKKKTGATKRIDKVMSSSPTQQNGAKVKTSSPVKPRGGKVKASRSKESKCDENEEALNKTQKNKRKPNHSPKAVKSKRRKKSSVSDKNSSGEETKTDLVIFNPKKNKKKIETVTSKTIDDDEFDIKCNVDVENNKQIEIEIGSKLPDNREICDLIVPHDVNIRVDSLPILMRTQNEDQLIEIEIIDNYKGNVHKENNETETQPKDLAALLNTFPDLSIEKVNVSNDGDHGNIEVEKAEVSQKTDAELFKIPGKVRTRSKCKTNLMRNNALRKMGMVTSNTNEKKNKKRKKK